MENIQHFILYTQNTLYIVLMLFSWKSNPISKRKINKRPIGLNRSPGLLDLTVDQLNTKFGSNPSEKILKESGLK